MALIIESSLLTIGKLNVEGCSNIRISIGKEALSIPYELKKDTKVYGKIGSYHENKTFELNTLSKVPEIDAIFVLTPASLSADSLYLSKETWYKMRDYGLLPDRTYVTITIEEIEIDGGKIKVYPNRIVRL